MERTSLGCIAVAHPVVSRIVPRTSAAQLVSRGDPLCHVGPTSRVGPSVHPNAIIVTATIEAGLMPDLSAKHFSTTG